MMCLDGNLLRLEADILRTAVFDHLDSTLARVL